MSPAFAFKHLNQNHINCWILRQTRRKKRPNTSNESLNQIKRHLNFMGITLQICVFIISRSFNPGPLSWCSPPVHQSFFGLVWNSTAFNSHCYLFALGKVGVNACSVQEITIMCIFPVPVISQLGFFFLCYISPHFIHCFGKRHSVEWVRKLSTTNRTDRTRNSRLRTFAYIKI